MKKIDIHAHVMTFPECYPPRFGDGERFFDAEKQFEIYDKINVERGVLLPLISPESQWCIISNESAKLAADKYPDRFSWFCNVDPRMGDNSSKTNLGYILEYYKKLGAKGLGELTANIYADEPRNDNLFGCCETLGMPVLIHIAPAPACGYGIIDDPGLPRIEKMLKKHPELKLIGHSAAFWYEFSKTADTDNRNGYPSGKITEEGRISKLMREYGNLYCDLSAGSGSNAMMRDREFTAKFFEEFADRIFYGCDCCSTKDTFQYDFDKFLNEMLADGMLSRENYEKIIRKNAEKLLGI